MPGTLYIGNQYAAGPNDQIGIIGDSITAQCSSSTSGHENYGYAFWMNFLSRQRFRFSHAWNFGVGGDTTTMILARLTTPLRSTPSTFVLLAGTNDRGSAAMTADQTITNLNDIISAFISVGKRVVLVPPLPRGDTTYTSNRLSGTQLANHMRVYRWCLEQAARPSVSVADPWIYWAVPGSATGDATLGYTHDGLHPNTLGAFYIGQAIADVLETLRPEPQLFSMSNTDLKSADNLYGCINLNPTMQGTAGSVSTGGSGSLADSYSGTNSSGTTNITRTYSKVTSGGKTWQQCIFGGTPTGTLSASDICRQISLHTSVAEGDIIELLADIEVDAGCTNIMSIQGGIQLTDGSGTTTLWDGDRYTTGSLLPAVAFSGVLRSPRITCTAGMTDLRARVASYIDASVATAGTMRVASVTFRKVDSL